ncbi:MAG: hypothetical protein ACT4PU_12905 [Planctomycetota bacterium]
MSRLRAALYLLHALLGTWAIAAWMAGPFGAGFSVVGSFGAGRFGESSLAAWCVGALGLACSLATLHGVAKLCRGLEVPAAELPAMAMWVVSGSALAHLPQAPAVLFATALLTWGVIALLSPRRGQRWRAVLVGVAALLAATWLMASDARWGEADGSGTSGAQNLGLRMRLGHGAARSGTTDFRPGPELDALRYEAAFVAWERGASTLDANAHHLARLREEVAADSNGEAATLLRKLWLWWHRAEVSAGLDFEYGFPAFTLLPLLLLSFGLVAPLALVGLWRARAQPRQRAALWLPVLGVLLLNLVFLVSSRHRLPALPFLCVAAGLCLAGRPRGGALFEILALGVVLNLPASVWPGALLQLGPPAFQPSRVDGLAQHGHMVVAEASRLTQTGQPADLARLDPARLEDARAALAEAVNLGDDPRARYDLGLACELLADVTGNGDLLLEAEDSYRAALDMVPDYAQAGENLIRVLQTLGRADEARTLAEELCRTSPSAGGVRVQLAELLQAEAPRSAETLARIRELQIEGHRLLALRALAQGDSAAARAETLELQRLGAPDAVLLRLSADP